MVRVHSNVATARNAADVHRIQRLLRRTLCILGVRARDADPIRPDRPVQNDVQVYIYIIITVGQAAVTYGCISLSFGGGGSSESEAGRWGRDGNQGPGKSVCMGETL